MKAKKQKPKKTFIRSIRFDSDIREALETDAKEKGCYFSQSLMRIVRKGLEIEKGKVEA